MPYTLRRDIPIQIIKPHSQIHRQALDRHLISDEQAEVEPHSIDRRVRDEVIDGGR